MGKLTKATGEALAEAAKVGAAAWLDPTGLSAVMAGMGAIAFFQNVLTDDTAKLLVKHIQKHLRNEASAMEGRQAAMAAGDMANLLYHFKGAPDFFEHKEDAERMAEALLERRPQYAHTNKALTRKLLVAYFHGLAARPEMERQLAREGRQEILTLLRELQGQDFYDPRANLPAPGTPPSIQEILSAHHALIPTWTPKADTRAADFRAWLASDAVFDVMVVAGDGGLGKTRYLLDRWDEAKGNGWAGGFLQLDRTTHKEGLGALGPFTRRMELRTQLDPVRPQKPLLAIIDYAEDRPHMTARLLGAFARQGGRRRRVVLLVRRVAALRQAIARAGTRGGIEHVLTRVLPTHRDDADGGFLQVPKGQRRALVQHFCTHLGPLLGVDPPRFVPDDAFFDRHKHFGLPLYLLAYAREAFDGRPPEEQTALLDALLTREYEHLGRCLDDVMERLEGSWLAQQPEMQNLLALATLAMAAGAEQTTHAGAPTVTQLMRESGVHDLLATNRQRRSVAQVLQAQYPPPAEAPNAMDAVRPDALGERLVEVALRKSPPMLAHAFAPTRAAAAHASAATVLYRAGYTLHPTEASAWLGALLDANDLRQRPGVREAFLATIPYETNAFGQLMADWADAETEQLRTRHAADPTDDAASQLAAHLNDLGTRYSNAGRYEDALKATADAADLYRSLYASNADRYGSDLAMSLNNLGIRYAEAGRYGDALEATEESVSLRRALYASNADRYGSDLARALNNLSVHYSNAGRYGEALLATEEAVDLYRSLYASNADQYGSYLAHALNNLGARYSEAGRYGEALLATEEAVDLYRSLYVSNADRYSSDLAMSLNNLSVDYLNAGRYEEALKATEEARDRYRSLYASNADRYGSDLANSVWLNAWVLVAADRGAEAVPIVEESLRLLTPYAQQRPQALARQLRGTMQTYEQACQQSETPMNEALVAPLRQLLDTLEGT